MRKHTPWGTAQDSTGLAPGIISYSTAGHGGIWLSRKRQQQLKYTRNYSGNTEWWEKDCDWVVPYITFASDIEKHGTAYRFTENLANALIIAKRYHPDFYVGK